MTFELHIHFLLLSHAFRRHKNCTEKMKERRRGRGREEHQKNARSSDPIAQNGRGESTSFFLPPPRSHHSRFSANSTIHRSQNHRSPLLSPPLDWRALSSPFRKVAAALHDVLLPSFSCCSSSPPPPFSHARSGKRRMRRPGGGMGGEQQ